MEAKFTTFTFMKILYNVTVKIDKTIQEEWVKWMKEEHIPKMINTDLFIEHKMCRLLGLDERDGITYAVQYVLADMNNFHLYQEKYAPSFQAKHAELYKNKYVVFRTLMEIVDS